MNVITIVDGIGINATHVSSMDKQKAVASLAEDFKVSHPDKAKDQAWLGKVYDASVKAVEDAKAKEQEERKKKK